MKHFIKQRQLTIYVIIIKIKHLLIALILETTGSNVFFFINMTNSTSNKEMLKRGGLSAFLSIQNVLSKRYLILSMLLSVPGKHTTQHTWCTALSYCTV